jgi:hypothetical protein
VNSIPGRAGLVGDIRALRIDLVGGLIGRLGFGEERHLGFERHPTVVWISFPQVKIDIC